jgi:Ser/Thr protein kinase RdoA (MazF antagonist)
MTESSATPYDGLTPDTILDALDACGFHCDGSLLALNSFENRVYQLRQEDESFVVVKFYRPGRWSDEAIREEHSFSIELAEHELPVVAPLIRDGETLFEHQGFRFAVFPRQGGYPPDLEIPEQFTVLARTLGRIHAVGASRAFKNRGTFSIERLGHESRRFLLENQWLPLELEPAYESITAALLEATEALLPDDATSIRIHGDCHLGNVLWRDPAPHFVDLDDCVTGPPIQDLWMLLSGERDEREGQLKRLLDAYLPFYELELSTLKAIEGLRTLRIMHHAAWIARRWNDPAFPLAFPFFDTQKYWSSHILELREQQAMLQEAPLSYSA